jgi:hypothetical protein
MFGLSAVTQWPLTSHSDLSYRGEYPEDVVGDGVFAEVIGEAVCVVSIRMLETPSANVSAGAVR